MQNWKQVLILCSILLLMYFNVYKTIIISKIAYTCGTLLMVKVLIIQGNI